MRLGAKVWTEHLAQPFHKPPHLWRTQTDDRFVYERAWGMHLARAAVHYAGDAATSFVVRALVTVPVAAFATSLWALSRPQMPYAWLVLAPVCGIVGGMGLTAMGLCCDTWLICVMSGLACANVVYAFGQSDPDTTEQWRDCLQGPPDVFGPDRAATACLREGQAQAQVEAQSEAKMLFGSRL